METVVHKPINRTTTAQPAASSPASPTRDTTEKEAVATAKKITGMAIPESSVGYLRTGGYSVFQPTKQQQRKEENLQGRFESPYLARFAKSGIFTQKDEQNSQRVFPKAEGQPNGKLNASAQATKSTGASQSLLPGSGSTTLADKGTSPLTKGVKPEGMALPLVPPPGEVSAKPLEPAPVRAVAPLKPAPALPAAPSSAPAGETAGPAPEKAAVAPSSGASEKPAAPASPADGEKSGAPSPAALAGEHAASAEHEPATGAKGKAGAAGAAVAVKLHMPEPPSGPSPATMKRIGSVQRRAGGAASAKAALPPGGTQVGAARQAVDQPDAEAKAHAQADLMAMLGEKAAPSPEIIALCQRIREVIRDKRPPDEDALMEAQPEGEALNAGNQLNASVESDTQKVQGTYSAIDTPPAGAAPVKGQELPGQPAAAATPALNAKAATPDPVPASSVSLDADAEAGRKKMQDAGMETPAAQLVQTGPVAEARGAQGELDQVAKEDPAKVLAGQKETLAKAEDNMAALQQQALSALTNSRASTTKGATSQQKGMVLSEEAKRTKASAEAQQIFTDAQNAVTALLKPLASNAIDEWEAAKTLLVAQFKADLAPVQKRVDERHSGVGGFFTGLWDAVTGLPGWAKEAYDAAERNFSEGVIAKITKISAEVNTVIATCELLIKTARDRIAGIFSKLGGSLGDWAKEQQAKFDGQLDKLHDQAIATRDNFNKDLMDRSKEAVDEVRAEISELRKKAGGLVGRIVNAINRFLDDPVKFIIEGLLDLLGIPAAAFWAVVAKIKKVIGEIADDPLTFASNLLQGLADGFGRFFDNFGTHLLQGFLTWLLGDLKGVAVPKDFSLKSIITFFLQLMGITWPNIRKILVKLVGAKNVALIEKVYSLVSLLMEKGPEGIYEMIKDKLDPQSIVDQVIQLAVDFMVSAIIKQVSARIILLFNPVGAILQALEAIYRVLKWIFQNAAKIFTLVETVVNGIADILAGNIGGFAAAVDKALAMLIAPVIAFIADYLSLGDLPSMIADKIKSMQEWVLGLVEKALTWIIEKGKALLASVGIGKKEGDKDKKKGGAVGEDISWTVRAESHHLWVATDGGHYVPMMASENPHPVKTAIISYRQQVDKLQETDEDAAKEAKGAIAKADNSLNALTAALDDYEKKSASGVEDKDLVGEKGAIDVHQEALKESVAEIQEHLGLNDNERVKKAKASFGSSPFSTVDGLAPLLELKARQTQKIVQAWKQKGIVFRVQSHEKDPEGLNTFDPAVAEWRETSPNNRQTYGYVNPKKTHPVGLTILSKGLLGSLENGKLKPATPSQKMDSGYHQKLAHYESARNPGAYPDFQFEAAILGHAEPGASGNWNEVGHTRTREQNYAWNQMPSNYHGPEHMEESAASGAAAERYELPTKERGSHESWWRHG